MERENQGDLYTTPCAVCGDTIDLREVSIGLSLNLERHIPGPDDGGIHFGTCEVERAASLAQLCSGQCFERLRAVLQEAGFQVNPDPEPFGALRGDDEGGGGN